MAYFKISYNCGDSIEYECKFVGKYGAKGEKRAPRQKITPELIAKQNQRNREKKVRRKIKLNFKPYDFWVTLTYPKGTRKRMKEVKADFRKFYRYLGYRYEKAGEKLKWFRRIEIGAKGGIHIHVLINRINNTKIPCDVMIAQAWKEGNAFFETVYKEGGFEKLANYIVKRPDEKVERQLSLLPEDDRSSCIDYSCSKNLKEPEVERKKYSHWTMRKILLEGPKPTKGYYIDKNSIYQGVNPFNGMSYLYYTEYKLDTGPNGSTGKSP